MSLNITSIFIFASLFLFVSCEEESVYSTDEKFVLQAYLYANEPVWDVSLRKTVSLTVTDSVGEPINEASVTLFKNGVAYPLTLDGDSGYYHYPESDLLINEGDVWEIEATYNGRTATAKSQVPEKPEGVAISNEVIELPQLSFTGTGRPDFASLQAYREALQEFEQTIVWNNPNNELFFVVIQSLSTDQEPIMNNNGGFGGGRERFGFRRVSAPTQENFYEVNLNELPYWGGYVAKVYKVNQEYADLYENLTQDSRDLNEPPTNVENGLGIFSAFNAENVFFEVKKQ